MSLPNQMQGNQLSNGNRAYRSSPNQKQGYQNRKQPRSLLTNEEKELSSPANRSQVYHRSQQQQQQQVFLSNPGLVHGVPFMNVPYVPVILPAPYINHPACFWQRDYYTEQDCNVRNKNSSDQSKTESIDTGEEKDQNSKKYEINPKIIDNERQKEITNISEEGSERRKIENQNVEHIENNSECIETENQESEHIYEENTGFFLVPWYPGQLVRPVPTYTCMPQPVETDFIQTEKAENSDISKKTEEESQK